MATANCIFVLVARVAPEHGVFRHFHGCTELICYLDGTGRLHSDAGITAYRPGDFSVYQPDAVHANSADNSGIQICVGVTGCGARRLPAGMWRADAALLEVFRRIADEGEGAGIYGRSERLDILAGWLVLEIRRLLGGGGGGRAGVDRAEQLRSEIDEHYRQNFDFGALAERLYVSRDYARQIFRARYSESPLSYLIRRRLELACELLRMTELPVAEVARRAGFDDAGYFSRLFRKRVGVPPTAYRSRK